MSFAVRVHYEMVHSCLSHKYTQYNVVETSLLVTRRVTAKGQGHVNVQINTALFDFAVYNQDTECIQLSMSLLS